MPRLSLALVLLVCTPIGVTGAAAQTRELRLAALEELMKIEVMSASRREQPVENVPAAVYVIGHDGIRRAYTLKGAASTAAAHGVADAARALERLAGEGRVDALDDAWARLSREAATLLQGPRPWVVPSEENSCEP